MVHEYHECMQGICALRDLRLAAVASKFPVVACTVSRAAMMPMFISLLKPDVVIVEEAAELLEV